MNGGQGVEVSKTLFYPSADFFLQNALTYTKINIKVAESGSKWFKVEESSRRRTLLWGISIRNHKHAAFSGR